MSKRRTNPARIHWTKEERSSLVDALVEHFSKQNLPYDQWKLTGQIIVFVSALTLPIERLRSVINNDEIDELQGLVNERVRVTLEGKLKAEIESILSSHRQFVEKHGMTPYERITELELKVLELEEAVEVTEDPPTKSATLGLPKPLIKTGVAQAVAEAQKKPLPILVVINHRNLDLDKRLSDQVNCAFLDFHANESAARQACDGRHVFVVEGQCSTSIAKALRQCVNKTGFTLVRGSVSALVRSIEEVVATRNSPVVK